MFQDPVMQYLCPGNQSEKILQWMHTFQLIYSVRYMTPLNEFIYCVLSWGTWQHTGLFFFHILHYFWQNSSSLYAIHYLTQSKFGSHTTFSIVTIITKRSQGGKTTDEIKKNMMMIVFFLWQFWKVEWILR